MFFDGSRYLKVPEYTAQDASGRPVKVKRVRATLAVGGSFVYQAKAGDRLDLLAYRFYRTPRKWWLICDANPGFMHPDEVLVPGQRLIIPPDRAV
jgi:phage tail protein X